MERLVGPREDADEAQAMLRGMEIMRLKEADLYYASSEMVSLAKAAAKSIPDFRLEPEDLPSRAGLIVFEGSPAALGFAGNAVATRAACWSHHPSGDGAVLVSRYADRREMAPIIAANTRYRQPYQEPALTYVHGGEMSWLFGDNDDVTPEESGPVFSQILRAMWLLMQQPLALVEDAQYKRHDRRRLERERLQAERVRVIKLRRATGSDGRGESDREYHHQWIVRGHWRQQYYPSRDVRRPVWIAPHIKGPEGAPLIGGEKVYAWTR